MMLPCCRLLIALAIVVTSSIVVTNSIVAAELVLRDRVVDAELSQWLDAENLQFTMTADRETIEVAADDLIRFGNEPAVDYASGLLMVDGSFIVGRIGPVDKDTLTLAGRYLHAAASEPLVRAIALQLPTNVLQREALLRSFMNIEGSDDRLMTINGDRLSGILQMPDKRRTPFRSAPAEWRLRQGDRATNVAAERLQGVVLSPVLHAMRLPTSGFWFVLADGSRLAVRSLQPQGDEVLMKLHCGQTLRFDGSWQAFSDTVVAIESVKPAAGSLVGERPLAHKQETMLSSLNWPLQNAANAPSEPVLIAGDIYRQAIVMHSNAQAVYAVPENASEFLTFVAIDGAERELEAQSEPESLGSVLFQVLTVDASKKPKLAAVSPVIRSGERPFPLSVDVRGVNLLVLVVRDAGDGSAGDRGVWLDARFSSEKN